MTTDPEIDHETKFKFRLYVGGEDGYRPWFQRSILEPVRSAFEGFVPASLSQMYDNIYVLENWCTTQAGPAVRVPGEHLGLMRRAALHYRHRVVLRQERLRALSVDPAYQKEIDQQSHEIETVLAAPWLADVAPIARPRLTDYVNLKTARELLANAGQRLTVERVYDEKFGILWGPGPFNAVLEAARNDAWLLGGSVGIAYLDIDDFKSINTTHSETAVDREVLPPFMLKLEAHTSSRGYAFRFGGDEYVLVLPNVDRSQTESLVERLRADIEATAFGPQQLTVSIGYVIVEHDSAMTNTEALRRANDAKNVAKKRGKNRACEGSL